MNDTRGSLLAIMVRMLEDLETDRHDSHGHRNEDIVRMTPEQLKARMAAKPAVE